MSGVYKMSNVSCVHGKNKLLSMAQGIKEERNSDNLLLSSTEAMFTRQRLIENRYDVFGFSCSVCTVYTAPFCQRKLIKSMECGRGILRRAHWHALVRMRRQRKRKFFSIGVVVGLLLASSTSMKAEVR